MSKEDLLRMLDLTGKEAAPQSSTELSITSSETQDLSPKKPASPTVLDLDEWGMRRGREVLADSERLQGLELEEEAIADFHGAAFEPDPKLNPECVDPQRRQFVQQLLETPEYQALHTSTMLNETASAIATTAFAEQFASLREQDTREKGELEREMDSLRAVGKALDQATREVEEAREMALALGLGAGAPGSNDPRAVAALYRRVRSNPTLKRICEIAGRYRRVAQSRQRRKTTHGLDDMVGVVLDGDLGRLLPQELAKLAIPEFEDDTLRRLVEKQVMCREYRATEPVGKGPIVIVVDESGSMEGEKIHTAKALALAMAWIARQQRRWCALIAFAGGKDGRLLGLPPGRWNEASLADWLEAFLGGGTTCDVPLVELPNRYWKELACPPGITDILCVTDAILEVPEEVKANFLRWKSQARARMITLVINGKPGDLASVSDEVHEVQSLSVEETAVERVLSI